MRCCIDRLAAVALLLLPPWIAHGAPGGQPSSAVADPGAPTGPSLTKEQCQDIAARLGDPAQRGEALAELRAAPFFPVRIWVDLLVDGDLAVRLGALEVLEDRTGSDLDYDPWEPDPVRRRELWLRWDAWAASGGKSTGVGGGTALGEGAMQAYLRDIVSGDSEKTERAVSKLQSYAAEGITAIEAYLSSQTDPGPGLRARLKEAQYRLLLDSVAVSGAKRVARGLAAGTRDEKVESLDALAGAPETVLPLVGEALADSDPLVRERAMDVLLSVGGSQAVPLAEAHLKKDADPNVAHAAIRALGKIEGAASVRALQPYLKGDDEDQISAALQSLSLLGENARSARSAVEPCLAHASWRVRAAALQYIVKSRAAGLETQILSLLRDEDSFVRSTAVQAVVSTSGASRFSSGSGNKGLPKTTETALLDAVKHFPDLRGPIFRAFHSADIPAPAALLEGIDTAPIEVRLAAIQALGTGSDRERGIIEKAAAGGQPDLSAAALRVLAKDPGSSDRARELVIGALLGDSEEKRDIVLDHLHLKGGKTTSRAPWTAAVEALGGGAAATAVKPPGTSAQDDALSAFGVNTEPGQVLIGGAVGGLTSAIPDESSSTQPPPARPNSVDALDAFGIGSAPPAPESPAKPNAGDALDAFGLGGPKKEGTTTAPGGTAAIGLKHSGLEGALDQLATVPDLAGDDPVSAVGRRAARLLVVSGSPLPAARLAAALPRMDVQDRADLAADLGDMPNPAYLPLWRDLLLDKSTEVRQRALRSALDEDYPVLLKFALDESFSPASPAEATDLYSRYLEYLCGDDGTKKTMAGVARALLANDRGVPHQVLGLIMLRSAHSSADRPAMEEKLAAKDYWVRRAAVMAIGRESPKTITEHFETLAADESVWVREAAAAVFGRNLIVWTHHFSDTVQLADEDDVSPSYFSSRFDNSLFGAPAKSTTLAPDIAVALRRLTGDVSERVRLAAWMTLLANKEEIDLPAVTALLSKSPDRDEWADRLAGFFSGNIGSIGPALRPLLSYANRDHIDEEKLARIESDLGGGRATQLRLDFGGYLTAKSTPPATASAAQFVPTDPAGADPATTAPGIAATPARLIFFHNPGCHECETVRGHLEILHTRFPTLQITEHNIRDTESVLLNEALCSRFGVDANLRQVTPAVFMQEGALVKDQIDRPSLTGLITATLAIGDAGAWHETATSEIDEARKVVEDRFSAIGLAGVFLAGLLDGVNPCAFATIIFLLSYLQVTRRSSGEILAVGGAFILSVFLTYFVLGLGLVEVVDRLAAFKVAGRALNIFLAIACLWVAWMSFRDARLARQGKLAEMSLQLPGFLKDRIRTVIRTGARSRRFVVAAFLSGIVISVLELACTGQVYLPTIVYAMKSGAARAVWFLLLYNLAFVVPLTIVFILAWRGLRSDALIRFQERHTATVKLALGWLFLLLFIALLWSGRL